MRKAEPYAKADGGERVSVERVGQSPPQSVIVVYGEKSEKGWK